MSDNESISLIITGGPKAWCLLTNGIIIHNMIIWLSLSDGGQIGRPKSDLIIYWSDLPNQVMLMVGPNQIFSVEAKAHGLGSWAKLITRSCLEKQLVMNLPIDAHGLTNQNWARV